MVFWGRYKRGRGNWWRGIEEVGMEVGKLAVGKDWGEWRNLEMRKGWEECMLWGLFGN